jgi:hypothetical protein
VGSAPGQGAQLVVAVQQVGDAARGEDDAASGQFAVDLGDAAVLGRAEPADGRHDVEAELVVGQGEAGFGLGAIRAQEARAIGVGAASDRQDQAHHVLERGDRAEVMVIGMEPVLAFWTVADDGRESQDVVGFRTRSLHSVWTPFWCFYVHCRRRDRSS